MTKEERRLHYNLLCSYPVRFSGQKALGKFIADLYSAEAKLVIELDDLQHEERDEIQTDTERIAFPEEYGLTVIRIQNNEGSRNLRGVYEYTDTAVTQFLRRWRGTPSLYREPFLRDLLPESRILPWRTIWLR